MRWGIIPTGGSHIRLPRQIPWAVAMRPLGWHGFIAAIIFIVILTVGLIYEWKKGALRWD